VNFPCPGSPEVANRNLEGMREPRFHSQGSAVKNLDSMDTLLLVHLPMSRSRRDSPVLLTKALLNIWVSPVTVVEEFSLALLRGNEPPLPIIGVGQWAHKRCEKGDLVVRKARKATDRQEGAARQPNGRCDPEAKYNPTTRIAPLTGRQGPCASVFEEGGIDRSRVYVTSIVKVRPIGSGVLLCSP
jgi:hypothetical protein